MVEIKDLTNEKLVKKIILNSIKAAQLGMVVIKPNDELAFESNHPFNVIAKELNTLKDEILRRLNK